jgi:hypothetical protein
MFLCHNKGMNDCNCTKRFNEYGKCVRAGIRNIAPSCKDIAVIPSVTVEHTAGLRGLADCFVHVNDNNTTYYIDDKGRMMIVWAGPVEISGYDYQGNPRNLRSQVMYDFANNRAVYYNAVGAYRVYNLTAGE